jgi:hypothetical protein
MVRRMIQLLFATVALAWDELGPNGVPTGQSLAASDRFSPGERLRDAPATPAADLGAVAAATARAVRDSGAGPGLFAELGVTTEDVLATLDFVAEVAARDAGRRRPRLERAGWVGRHFDVYTWASDVDGAQARQIALTPDQIRLTSYLVYQSAGSPVRTDIFDTALYALPSDEVRLALTRPDVYAGAFESGGVAEGAAEPLVWLSRRDVNRALMQGSVEVHTDDGRVRMFNVHENNGIAYDPAQKDGNRQRRYWYFREVDGVRGVAQIPLVAHAAVAGDVYNLGLGKLVALQWEGKLHLVVLADTGGAFQPNLFQLDWFAGTFPDHDAYAAWAATRPDRVQASVLVRKGRG